MRSHRFYYRILSLDCNRSCFIHAQLARQRNALRYWVQAELEGKAGVANSGFSAALCKTFIYSLFFCQELALMSCDGPKGLERGVLVTSHV
jgi:hypothetical protein